MRYYGLGGVGAFPRWLLRLGFIASVFVFLLGPSVMGILGVPVWVLGVSVHWLRDNSTRATAAPTVA